MSERVAALDLGSSKVALAVGERAGAGIRIVSYHDAPSAGVECGEIINDNKVAEVVRTLIAEAEAELGEKISEVTVGLSGRVLRSRTVSCDIRRRDPASCIDDGEVRQIVLSQYKADVGDGETVFEAVPQRYSTEDRIGITQDELIGMVGTQVEAEFRLFSGRRAIPDRRAKVLEDCGLQMHKAVLAPVASARAVLSAREMESGVALVDIGKGTTEVAVVKDNVVRHVAVIPFAGEAVTGDIKTETGITRLWAEALKLQQGRCCEEYAIENRKMVLKNENGGVDGEVDSVLLTRIVEARVSEIFDAVEYVIKQSGYGGRLPGGVVVTGGSSHLENIIQLAGSLLGRKVRLAAPQGSIAGDSAEGAFDVYASTAVGLVLEAMDPRLSFAPESVPEKVAEQPEERKEEQPRVPEPQPEPPVKGRGGLFGGRRKAAKKDADGDGQLSLFGELERMFVSKDDGA